MLEKHVTDFLAFCKITDFSKRSIESLSISLWELSAFIGTQPVAAPGDIPSGRLSDFVAVFIAAADQASPLEAV